MKYLLTILGLSFFSGCTGFLKDQVDEMKPYLVEKVKEAWKDDLQPYLVEQGKEYIAKEGDKFLDKKMDEYEDRLASSGLSLAGRVGEDGRLSAKEATELLKDAYAKSKEGTDAIR